jgi:hypothetical protein
MREHEPEKYEIYKRKIQERRNARRKENPWIRAKNAVFKRIYRVKRKKGIPAYDKNLSIGCDLHQFKSHLESLWKEGMSWDNYGVAPNGGRFWELDHIKALKNFDLTKYEDALECSHYTNIQPLWVDEHREKSKNE